VGFMGTSARLWKFETYMAWIPLQACKHMDQDRPPVTDYRKIVDIVRGRGPVHYAKTVIPILRTQGKEPLPDTACP
jgi:hypothetical protein